ncbi:hypothetical protein O3W44_23020 [Pantoea sp. LMR881]|uniref:hypothetical protein n=1 Tax=Pantoea sp. LMR881 TaxID=3014336 RepID=UPI0022AEF4DD|nr:hypothetical protein [Pantoea sp. LMR881]MCZ4061395.1 hypothetical protein [Pantoea sp. LMR881]
MRGRIGIILHHQLRINSQTEARKPDRIVQRLALFISSVSAQEKCLPLHVITCGTMPLRQRIEVILSEKKQGQIKIEPVKIFISVAKNFPAAREISVKSVLYR